MEELLFVYGTLQEPKVQQKIVGRFLDSDPDVLQNHTTQEVTISGKTYPILIETQNKEIRGVVLHVLNSDFTALDKYETSAYKRVKIKLKSGTVAWVYMKNE